MTASDPRPHFLGVDALTGVGNHVGFFEQLLAEQGLALHSPFTTTSLPGMAFPHHSLFGRG